MDSRARALLSRLDAMRGQRGLFDSQWEEIARHMNPMRSGFLSTRSPGEKRTELMLDGTASQAAENLAAGLWGMLTNSATTWFSLRSQDETVNEDRDAKVWLADSSRRMLDELAAGGQRFYAQMIETLTDLVLFGTSVFYIDEPRPGRRGLYYSCRPLSECYIAENAVEQVDTVFRRYQATARQAVQRWGDRVGARVKEIAEKRPDDPVTCLHAVLPAEEYDGRVKLPVASVYLMLEDGHLLEEGGYHEFPYMVPRWSQRSRSVYGDSPAMLALPDAKMLGRMVATTINAAEKAVDPVLLTSDENALKGLRLRRGAIVTGALDDDGRPKYRPLEPGGQIGLGLEMEQQRRSAIREYFYSTLLLLVNQPGRTATEVLALQEEKMRLMGPHLGRVQAELLDPLIGRVFNIMLRAGAFRTPPRSMASGPDLTVEYVSPMARAQKAGEAVAVTRTLEAVGPLAQASPEVSDLFDMEQMARVIANAHGLPPQAVRAPQDVAKIREGRAQQQAMAAAAQAAPGVAKAAKDGAHAAQIAQQVEQMA